VKYSIRAKALHALFAIDGLEDCIEMKNFPHIMSIAESSLLFWKSKGYMGLHYSKQYEANLMLLALSEWIQVEGLCMSTTCALPQRFTFVTLYFR
jgi:hypothetical protein